MHYISLTPKESRTGLWARGIALSVGVMTLIDIIILWALHPGRSVTIIMLFIPIIISLPFNGFVYKRLYNRKIKVVAIPTRRYLVPADIIFTLAFVNGSVWSPTIFTLVLSCILSSCHLTNVSLSFVAAKRHTREVNNIQRSDQIPPSPIPGQQAPNNV